MLEIYEKMSPEEWDTRQFAVLRINFLQNKWLYRSKIMTDNKIKGCFNAPAQSFGDLC